VDNQDEAAMRLSCITKSLLLRRTKGGLKTLPEKKFILINVKMDENEFSLYEKIAHFSQ
jgi:SNF2 family DNA or RNA helicase